jgi:hypothetical protein
MTKRSRKSAFGKAGVLRRSSLKTIPVLAIDPLSLENLARRKTVRSTLMFGSAMGASLLAVTVFTGQPAMAQCIAANPFVNCSSAINYPGGIPWSPGFSPLDLTVTSPDTQATWVGSSGATNGDGIHMDANANGQVLTITTTADTYIGVAHNANSYQVSRDAVHMFSSHYNTSLTIVNHATIGDNVTRDGLHAVVITSGGTFDSISVTNTGTIATVGRDGIHAGGDLDAPSNAGTVTTFITNANTILGVGGQGIHGWADVDASFYNDEGAAVGRTAVALTTIFNSPAISSVGDAIEGHSDADANGIGTFIHPTSVYSGGSGVGGVAVAGVVIGNGTADSLTSSAGAGIDGRSSAEAEGHGFHGLGGQAIATTTITNSSNIFSFTDGIHGRATATADSRGSKYSNPYGAGSSTAGNAIASVVITNSGTITSHSGEGIDGRSEASADAVGYWGDIGHSYNAVGGHATATTVINNTGAIWNLNDGTARTGIRGEAEASANAYGSYSVKGSAIGGVAVAGVVITNTSTAGTIFSMERGGIDGSASAEANAGKSGFGGVFGPKYSYHAVGGTAIATTTIVNAAAITTERTDISGSAEASANAFGGFASNGTFGPGGSATGGVAIAGVLISNSGALYSTVRGGIDGQASAEANAHGFTALGGSAQATTTIYNVPAIISGAYHPFGHGDGIHGSAEAEANAFGSEYSNSPIGLFGSATGGSALAQVLITNGTADPVSSYHSEGLDGSSRASANAGSFNNRSYFAIGGNAQAGTTILNGSAIFSSGDGITAGAHASANAFGSDNFYGGNPGSPDTTNGGTPCPTIDDDPGIPGCVTPITIIPGTPKVASGPGGLASGGVAIAGVLISNTGSASTISSYNGEGLDGRSSASANAFGFRAYGGSALASTVITNAPAITSPGDAIRGRAEAEANAHGGADAPGFALGGYALANVLLTNGTADTLSSINGEGIDGASSAEANAGSWRHRSYTAIGGTAFATTTILNGSAITSEEDGIKGRAEAEANAFGGTVGSGASATGGVAVALVIISNSGAAATINTSTSGNGEGIDGRSSASANAFGFTALGGNAQATTTIVNTPAIISGGTGIEGSADAEANAFGSASAPGFASGGLAVADVFISNGTADAIFSKEHRGIDGSSSAEANAGSFNHRSYTAIAGTAQATTTIVNGSQITTEKDDIKGTAEAEASAFGSDSSSGTAGPGGSAIGGVAIAGVLISNTGGPLYSTGGSSGHADGIDGQSSAEANAHGFTAIGGHAQATTTIINTPAITVAVYGGEGDGIHGRAEAEANAHGPEYSNVPAGVFSSATGGFAFASVLISNGAADPIASGSALRGGDGIDGSSSAEANAASFQHRSYFAIGGTAAAYTTILNGSAITSFGDGITAGAHASANAFGSDHVHPGVPTTVVHCPDPEDPYLPGCYITNVGSPAGPGGLASGGVAIASVVISNSGTAATIDSYHGEGIDGRSSAEANAFAFKAYGGHAQATTTIVNAPHIESYRDGIRGTAEAEANAHGSFSAGGFATGGVAIAAVLITNGTSDPIVSFNGDGIDGQSSAEANAGSWRHRSDTAIGGTAQATTTILNGSLINSYRDGIRGSAEAEANAFGNDSKGASATGGVAIAAVVISNGGEIETAPSFTTTHTRYVCDIEPLILGPGSCVSGHTETFTVTHYPEGIDGSSSAEANAVGFKAYGGHAQATTTIVNTPAIYSGGDSIKGTAEAEANAHGDAGSGGLASGGVAFAAVFISNGAYDPLSSSNGEGIDGRSSAEADAHGHTAVGGAAQATTSIANGSAIVSEDEGIVGRSSASANAFGFTAFGGTAIATTTILNTPQIVTNDGDGIKGTADAEANAHGDSGKGGLGSGGVAIADVYISNGATDGIFSKEKEGIDGQSSAEADAGSWHHRSYVAIGGHAQATTTIVNGSPIWTEKDDLTGSAEASASAFSTDSKGASATGGVAFAGVIISNTGTLYNTRGQGIDGQSSAAANAFGFKAFGGNAQAFTSIVNTPAITSHGDGIHGEATAEANAHGGNKYAGFAQGGTALANVVITNGANDPVFSLEKDGIDGESSAEANAGSRHDRSYTAIGGFAQATTLIVNGSDIRSEGDGITGSAEASADAFGSDFINIPFAHHFSDDPIFPGSLVTGPGGLASGGVALAGVLISNTGTVYTTVGSGIEGESSASADARGFTAFGGYARATTTIVNGPAITSAADGIKGTADASANARGGHKYSGLGQGGTALATVLITNGANDPITTTKKGAGIDGESSAEANAGSRHDRSYTAIGGFAQALTTIINLSAINSHGDGIAGSAEAEANAVGSDWIHDPFAHHGDDPVPFGAIVGPGGSATGGTALASVVISNSGVINAPTFTTTFKKLTGSHYVCFSSAPTSPYTCYTGHTVPDFTTITVTHNPEGIDGKSSAEANASGFSAFGGFAQATTLIVNAPAITSGGDGIQGTAEAEANARGEDESPGFASGGVAIASVVIVNGSNDKISSKNGNGIDGRSSAEADAGSPWDGSFTAIAGSAQAITSITNASAITSHRDGINGEADASADAFGVDAKGSSATGGTALANVWIRNSNTITSSDGDGIDGSSSASANAFGFKAFGGNAQATTTIVNTPAIVSSGDGIEGEAEASADAFGSSSKGGFASGGTALALVLITNGTADPITSSDGEGIDGKSSASADAGSRGNRSYQAVGGHAWATTSITNGSFIKSDDDGIEGRAKASADAFGVTSDTATGASGTGGLAVATLVISNAGTVYGGKEGIDGQSSASANARGFKAFGGQAQASTSIFNIGTIGAFSGDGIDGFANASANARGEDEIGGLAKGGWAGASVFITNAASVQSTGARWENYHGTGIAGSTSAEADAGSHFEGSFTAQAGTAIASTVISNTGYIRASQGQYFTWQCTGEGENRHCHPVSHSIAGDGIDGLAAASAEAHSAHDFGSTATGGTAQATVLITNLFTGLGIVAYYGNGIFGQSSADANAFGFNAHGGSATANTTIINTAVIQSDDGIDGFANAFAEGQGSNKADPGSGTGGVALANVLITNSGNIFSSFGPHSGKGIYGFSFADAYAKGRQAFGGLAQAITTINNTGATIKSNGDGINGTAIANASAMGKYGTMDYAKGGTAIAHVTINNTANITSLHGYGINANTSVSANGYLCTKDCDPDLSHYGKGLGGNAVAVTSITNIGSIKSADDGISGHTSAFANGTRIGGYAAAVTTIIDTNTPSTSPTAGKILVTGSYAEGIDGQSLANANGYGKASTGGTAKAATLVINGSGARGVYVYGGNHMFGVLATSTANANGALRAGTAIAQTTVTNAGFIFVHGDDNDEGPAAGVWAGSTANAKGPGGIAFASSYVTNSFKILTDQEQTPGIDAYANAIAGATATAVTHVSNSSEIATDENRSPGIKASSTAKAGNLRTGLAQAGTYVTNNGGAIGTFDDPSQGIVAFSGAYAGGKATAYTKALNIGGSIYTTSDGSAGISAKSVAGGFYSTDDDNLTAAGTAIAITVVSNSGIVRTFDDRSPGLKGSATASGYYTGTAATIVSNNGSIFTNDDDSPGISARSSASARGVLSTADALTFVGNSFKIITDGRESAGIKATSDAYGDARARTFVFNYSGGSIITNDDKSPGIDASSHTIAVTGNATAQTIIGNAGSITTNDDRSAGVRGKAYASGILGAANALATFTNYSGATVTTNDDHSDGVSLWAFAGALKNASATASVFNAGTITTNGRDSTGIELYAGAVSGVGIPSAVASVTNTGSVITHGRESDAIDCTVVGDSSCNVTNTGFIQTYGRESAAIHAKVTDNTAAGGSSIIVMNTGGGTYSPESIKTSDDRSDAIKATINGNNASIKIFNYGGSIWTYGRDSEAIDATVNGVNGRINITNTGTILTGTPDDLHSGSKSDAIKAAVGVNGQIVIANIGGSISTYGTKSDAVNVAVLGGVNGKIIINNTNNGTNIGTIAAYNSGYHAIVASGALTTINSSGYIFGNLQLSALNDAFNNSGKWMMAGNSNFGRGNDVVSNTGVVTMLSGSNGSSSSSKGHGEHGGRNHKITPSVLAVAGARYSNIGGQQTYYAFGPVVSGTGHHKHGDTSNLFYTVFLSNLETFINGNGTSNSGLIDLRDGHPNQQIVVSGNFVGAGGALAVDAYLGGSRNPNCVFCGPNKFETSGGESSGQQQQQQQQQQIVINVTVNNYGTNTGTVTDNSSGGSGGSSGSSHHGHSVGSAASNNLGSDLLTVGGNFTGNTTLVVNDTNPGLGAYDPIGIPVIIVGGNVVNASVTLPGDRPIIKGLFDYDIYLAGGVYNPATKTWSSPDPFSNTTVDKNVWVLASTPNQAANELPRLKTAAADIWHQASGTWADRSADLRGYFFERAPQPECDPRMITKAPCLAAPAPSNIGPGVWARGFGDWSHNGGSVDEGLFGKTHTYDVTYKQDTYGMQAGFDFAAQKTGYENFVFGFMAGALDSKVSFASGTGAKFSGGNLGAYATLINGGLFADALLMANFMNLNYQHSTLISDTDASVFSVGGHFDVGYRFNFGGYASQPTYDPRMITKAPYVAPERWNWFVEPLGTIEAMWTHFHNFDLPGVDLDMNANSVDLRGRLGARIGTSIVRGGYKFEPSLTLSLWHSFAGENFVDMTSDCYTISLNDANSHLTYGEVGLALSVLDLGSRWSAFVKGDYRFADDYYGGSVKLGARFQW